MPVRKVVSIGAVLLCLAAGAHAEPPATNIVRLLGDAPDARDPMPQAFVIDARVTPGETDSETSLHGWFAAVAEPALSGELTGSCVDAHCVATVERDGGNLVLDWTGADENVDSRGVFRLKGEDESAERSGPITLSSVAGPVAGLGPLAAPDAIAGADLDEFLLWAGQTSSSWTQTGQAPPNATQRKALAAWQASKGRLATGLMFVADLDQLKMDAAAARKAAGWKTLGGGDVGWSAGYPARLFSGGRQVGDERTFSSHDGLAKLIIAIDPPMSEESFDVVSENLAGEQSGRKDLEATRTNTDVEARFEQGGEVTVAVYRRRENGVGRLLLTYPADRAADFAPFELLLRREFKVCNKLK